MLKKFSYIFWWILLLLSLFWIDAYLANHTYYYSMLKTLSNWWIVIFGLIAAMIPVLYVFFSSKLTFRKILFHFLIGFAIFFLVLWLNKWWFVWGWYLVWLVNFAILFFFWLLIFWWFLAVWDLALNKVNFKRAIYEFAVKLWTWLALTGILLYWLVWIGYFTPIVAYIVLWLLVIVLFLQGENISTLIGKLILEIKESIEDLKQSEHEYLLWIFGWIFIVAIWYVFVWLNYTFIPYPTAWDANHAYMFVPRMLWIYNGYPWWTDFRPDMYFWYPFLTWMYQLWRWTWFAPDTWMITFNFFSWIFSLFFGFMLVATVVRFLQNKWFFTWEVKKYWLLITGYVLILARLTSWNGAFLVFVDNKTDLAVMMFVILWLFLALYSLERKSEGDNWKNILTFVALSGFFFGIANLIKPTATFDFFETTLVLTILEIGFLTVIWIIIFVVWLLAYLKFRGFDKAVNPKFGLSLMGWGLILSIIEVVYKFIKDKFKVIYLLTFVFSFIWTLIFTKGYFGIIQSFHDKIDTNPKKIITAFIMSDKLPVKPQKELTGVLFKDLKKTIWSSYNEDNGRYVWYGNKDFGNPWWSFIVPSKFKEKYCVILSDQQSTKGCSKILTGWDIFENAVNNLTIKIFNNKDEEVYKKWILYTIQQAEKNWTLKKLAKQLWLDANMPDWKLKEEILSKLTENTQKQLLLAIKQKLLKWDLNLSDYPGLFQTEENKKLFDTLKVEPYYYSSVSIPYSVLVPFNEVFNWSLQNLTSYYTDIGVIWLVLFIVVLFALIYGIYLWILWVVRYTNDAVKGKTIFAFAFATLVGWIIWYFVASGIIWYNIWGIVWLIITSVIFLSKWDDRYLLLWVILFVSFVDIFLNLIRIASQWGGQIQTWYRSSIGLVYDYEITNQGIVPIQKQKMPYTFDDVFKLQFGMYRKPIEAFDERKPNQMGIIWWTYMRYFVSNQNKIKNDQFLTWLWRMWSDNNAENTYKRFKAYGLKDIVIDPNIASVVMWTWNISLWYRYFGKTNDQGYITEKWVMPMFVDLASKWYLKYWFTNNLWIKYALIYSDEELSKILWIKDLNKVRQIRYELTSIKFLPRNVGFEHPNSNINMKMYNEAIDAFYKILVYRLNQAWEWNPIPFASDLMDVNGYYIKDLRKLLENGLNPQTFDSLSFEEKTLLIQLMNILNKIKQNPSSVQNVLKPIIQNAIAGRAQLLFVKVK